MPDALTDDGVDLISGIVHTVIPIDPDSLCQDTLDVDFSVLNDDPSGAAFLFGPRYVPCSALSGGYDTATPHGDLSRGEYRLAYPGSPGRPRRPHPNARPRWSAVRAADVSRFRAHATGPCGRNALKEEIVVAYPWTAGPRITGPHHFVGVSIDRHDDDGRLRVRLEWINPSTGRGLSSVSGSDFAGALAKMTKRLPEQLPIPYHEDLAALSGRVPALLSAMIR